MNKPGVLITSVGAKVAMIQAVTAGFRKVELETKIFGADADDECIGQYFVSEFWQMPRLDDMIVNDLLDYCQANGITHIIPSRDGELHFFAVHRHLLKDAGIEVMVSSAEAIDVALDKLEFAKKLIPELPAIPTFSNINSQYQQWVVKERHGAGARRSAINVTANEAIKVAETLISPIFQPYISGTEYSIDLYLTAQNDCLGYVVRSRDKVVDGESMITTSRSKPEIGQLAIKVCKHLNLTGHCLVQVIEDNNGQHHIIEVNPRYGGASGLSVSLGLDSFYWFAMESKAQDLTSQGLKEYPAGMQLIKYKQERVISNDN